MKLEARERKALDTISGECLAVRLRSLHRAVTRLYDDALRPHGIRIGQLSLLTVVGRLGDARAADVCRYLNMEKSTLSRDLAPLRANGWLETIAGEDGREKRHRLTAEGAALVAAATPAWRDAQREAKRLLGAEAAEAISRAAEAAWVE